MVVEIEFQPVRKAAPEADGDRVEVRRPGIHPHRHGAAVLREERVAAGFAVDSLQAIGRSTARKAEVLVTWPNISDESEVRPQAWVVNRRTRAGARGAIVGKNKLFAGRVGEILYRERDLLPGDTAGRILEVIEQCTLVALQNRAPSRIQCTIRRKNVTSVRWHCWDHESTLSPIAKGSINSQMSVCNGTSTKWSSA